MRKYTPEEIERLMRFADLGDERFIVRLQGLIDKYTEGYRVEYVPRLYASDVDEVSATVQFWSVCEHHLVPFFGTCTIRYKPRGKVIGLSKLDIIVRKYAHRPQLQERLTRQVAQEVLQVTGAEWVEVTTRALHLCKVIEEDDYNPYECKVVLHAESNRGQQGAKGDH